MKNKTIVDVINDLRAKWNYKSHKSISVEECGDKVFFIGFDGEFELKEFNKCIKEMSNHAGNALFMEYLTASNMPLTKENSDYSFYEKEKPVYTPYQEVTANGFGDRVWQFGCMLPNSDNCMLVSDGSHVVMHIESITPYAKPIKTPKQKQIDQLMLDYGHWFNDERGDLEAMFNDMFEMNDLREVEND